MEQMEVRRETDATRTSYVQFASTNVLGTLIRNNCHNTIEEHKEVVS